MTENQSLRYCFQPSAALAPVFTDKEQLSEAADIIQKLQLVAQELPAGKYGVAQKQIGLKYDEIERSLIEEFVRAQSESDRQRMKHIASILSHFKGYSQCIDAFIEQSQMVRHLLLYFSNFPRSEKKSSWAHPSCGPISIYCDVPD